MKLELKHLAPYLPYELKMYWENLVGEKLTPWVLTSSKLKFALEMQNKPILRNLSDLTKEIEVDGEKFVPIKELFNIAYSSIYDYKFEGEYEQDKDFDIHLALKAKEDNWDYGFTIELPYQFRMSANGSFLNIPQFELYQKLFQWHFDIFGLIPQGLAIDINTLK